MLKSAGYEWLSGLLIYSLLIAPFGCALPTFGLLDGGGLLPGGASTSTSGLFINPDTQADLMIAGRGASGDAFFVFGTRKASGAIDEIDSILVRGADGAESFIAFESGRPTHARGPDGSYANVVYETVSATSLSGTVELFDASSGQQQLFPFEIDPAQTVDQIAALIRQASGRDFSTTEIEGSQIVTKNGTEQVRITVFSPLYSLVVVPFIAAIGAMTVILGQVLVAMLELVTATIEAVVLVAFTPLFVFAELLSEVSFRVRLSDFDIVFGFLPPPPVIVLT